MSYRNKTYIAFDGDNDMPSYRLMTAWKANKGIDFNFYDAHDLNTARDSSQEESIKAQLRERMANSKQMILLVGENTKYLRKFVPWEVQIARKMDIPIVLVNLNGKREFDDELCPAVVKDGVYTISVSLNASIVKYALENFPTNYYGAKDRATRGHNFHYKKTVYSGLGL